MRTFSHLPRLSRSARLCWLFVAAGCATTSESEITPLREEVSALRQAHQADRKRLEALEVLVDAQQMELKRLRGDAPEDGALAPANGSALPIVHLQPHASHGAPVLPTDVRVREPPVGVVAELERNHARSVDEAGPGGSTEEADRLYDAAFEKLKTGELVGAAGMFRDFARRFPHHPAADNALLDEGIAYYGLRRYQEAFDVFESLAKRYPAGDAVAEGLWRASDCQIKLGEVARAETTLRTLIKSYAGTPEATKAATQLTVLESKAGDKASNKAEDLAKTEGGAE